jgi:hypothetical protein
MKNPASPNPQHPESIAAPGLKFALWQQLKDKRISYLTLPLLIMATVTEFVILATGWKYQQAVCLPHGMGVTFFGIGPIGATILAVELLKLPLAIWTASRVGWQKGAMLVVGLPLICLLTFQLVKDMAVYEMGVALTPASELLEKASTEEIKIAQFNGELATIEKKRADRDQKLAELAGRKAKAKADLEESLKRNDESRQDAISLTDYQKKELSDVDSRQAAIIKQFDADAAQLTKAIADLRARRETEVARATKWNAEEARIENAYKVKLAEYTNKKTAYDKDLAEYNAASFLKRQLMKEPIDPGVAPVRESNTVLKPAEIAEIDAQIKAKEGELLAVNSKRRDRVAQVDTDARRMREDFDRRSSTKREEADRKRDELLAAQTTLAAQWTAEEKQINQDFDAAAQKADSIRTDLDASRKQAEGFYEAREAAIKNTQVHRIATTVEIVRGLMFGKRPVSITATAKERGDLYTDQISMVRIWVYPVLAFIVAFLPTLMVEVGFSTLFKPEQKRPAYRMGFLGRRLHWLYTRAGRFKILRAERIAREATEAITSRDEALVTTKAQTEQALLAKEAEVAAVHEALDAAEAAHAEQMQQRESEWVAKFGGMADSLNHALAEKDALRDFQQSEIERQVQQRQKAWSDRLTQMRQELDAARATHETERAELVETQRKKQIEVTEDCKNQVAQARRQLAEAQLATEETSARLAYDLKEALNDRDLARTQLQQLTESHVLQLAQAREDGARELDKASRQAKHRLELQQLELGKALRQRNEDFEHQLKQREQELTLAFENRLAEEQTRVDQENRRREEEFERQMEARIREVDARWSQETQEREAASQARLKQREQQLQALAEVRLNDAQAQAEQLLRRRESELERQLDTQAREADRRLKQEAQHKELEFQARLKQREQELTSRAAARETELENQWAADLRRREEEWERQAGARVLATETRLLAEAQQKEELLLSKSRQRDVQWQEKLDTVRAELQSQNEQTLRRREVEADAAQRALRDLESSLRKEMQQKEEVVLARTRQHEQELVAQFTAQTQASQLAAREEWNKESESKIQAATVALKTQLTHTEKERDEAKMAAFAALGQVQDMEKKLTEASSFLNGWKNGKHLAFARG